MSAHCNTLDLITQESRKGYRLINQRDGNVSSGEHPTKTGHFVEHPLSRREVEYPLDETVVEQHPRGTLIEIKPQIFKSAKSKVKVKFPATTLPYVRAFRKVIERTHGKPSLVRRVGVIVPRGVVRHADMQLASGREDAIQVFEYRYVVDVFEDIATHNYVKAVFFKRQRQVLNIMHYVNAGPVYIVEIHTSRSYVRSRTYI